LARLCLSIKSELGSYVCTERGSISAGILRSASPFSTGSAGKQYPESPGLSSGAAVAAAAAKTRLRWTPELHEKFLTVVGQLGGADRECSITFPQLLRNDFAFGCLLKYRKVC
jgi:hypothetical protein